METLSQAPFSPVENDCSMEVHQKRVWKMFLRARDLGHASEFLEQL